MLPTKSVKRFLYFYLIASKSMVCTDTKVWFSSVKGKYCYLFSEYKSLNEKKNSRNEKYQWKIHFVQKLVNYYSRSKWMFCDDDDDEMVTVRLYYWCWGFFLTILWYTWMEMIFMLLCASRSRLHINYILTTSNRNWIRCKFWFSFWFRFCLR